MCVKTKKASNWKCLLYKISMFVTHFVFVVFLEDGVYLSIRHCLGSLSKFRLGQVTVTIPVVGVKGQLSLVEGGGGPDSSV